MQQYQYYEQHDTSIESEAFWTDQCQVLGQQILFHREFLNTQVAIYDDQPTYSMSELLGIPETPEDFDQNFSEENYISVQDGGSVKRKKSKRGGGGLQNTFAEFRKLYVQHATEQNMIAFRLDEVIGKVSSDGNLMTYLNATKEDIKANILQDDEKRVQQQIERLGQNMHKAVQNIVNPFMNQLSNLRSISSPVKNVQNSTSYFVQDLLTAYENLTIHEKLHGIQKIFYHVLKMLWRKLMDRLQLPQLPFDGIKNINGFVDHVTKYVNDTILTSLNDDDIDLKTLYDTVDVAVNIVHMVKLMVKIISNQDEEYKPTLDTIIEFLQHILVELSTVKTYINNTNKFKKNVNIYSYTPSISKFISQQKTVWLARIKVLSEQRKYETQIESIEKLTKQITTLEIALKNTQKIRGNEVEVLCDITKHYIKHFLNIISVVPQYSGLNVSLSDMIKNSQGMQEVLQKMQGFSRPEVNITEVNINTTSITKTLVGWTRNVWEMVKTVVLPQFRDIPNLEEVFSIFSICFSFTTDFAGFGLVTIINMGIMLLYYINALFAKPLHCKAGRSNPTMCDLKAYQQQLNERISGAKFRSVLGGGTRFPNIQLGVSGVGFSSPPVTPAKEVMQRTEILLMRAEIQRYAALNITVHPTLDERNVKKINARTEMVDNICETEGNPDFNELKYQYLTTLSEQEEHTFFQSNDLLMKADFALGNEMKYDKNSKYFTYFFVTQYENERDEQLSGEVPVIKDLKALAPTMRNTRPAISLPQLGNVRVQRPMIVQDRILPPIGRRGGSTSLTRKGVQEINTFLHQKTKDELYVYAKSKKYEVSKTMLKQDLIDCIINNHKKNRKNNMKK